MPKGKRMDTRHAKTSVVYSGAIETGKIETFIIFLESGWEMRHVGNCHKQQVIQVILFMGSKYDRKMG